MRRISCLARDDPFYKPTLKNRSLTSACGYADLPTRPDFDTARTDAGSTKRRRGRQTLRKQGFIDGSTRLGGSCKNNFGVASGAASVATPLTFIEKSK